MKLKQGIDQWERFIHSLSKYRDRIYQILEFPGLKRTFKTSLMEEFLVKRIIEIKSSWFFLTCLQASLENILMIQYNIYLLSEIVEQWIALIDSFKSIIDDYMISMFIKKRLKLSRSEMIASWFHETYNENKTLKTSRIFLDFNKWDIEIVIKNVKQNK